MALPQFLENLDPEVYLSDNYIVLDKETTNLDKGSALNPNNRHILSVWEDSNKAHQSEIRGSEYQLSDLLDAVGTATFIVAHNAKFELQWLAREGLDLHDILVWDTQVAEYILLGNRKKPLGLGAVAERRGFGTKEKYIDICMKAGICPSELPSSLLSKRCRTDVRQTHEIFLEQRQELIQAGLLGCMYTACLFTPVLADIETKGMCIDKESVRHLYTRSLHKKIEIERELDKLSGGINLGSPKQLGELLYDTLKFKELKWKGEIQRTATGKPKTDIDTILSLKATTKRQKMFQNKFKEWNYLSNLLSKNLEFFYGVASDIDNGVFYAQFNQTVTVTHRLSSSGRKIKFKQFPKEKGCQFQNFPRKLKPLFKARKEGWLIGDRDGAQLEFRVAAYLGNDAQALDDIVHKVDVHSNTAKTLTEAGQYTERQEAKAHTFKPLFGGVSGTKAEKEYYAWFLNRYSGIAETQQRWIDEALRTKKVVTPTGMVFYYPGARVTSSGWVEYSTNIKNYPVQYLATGEIIPIAVIYMWHKMKDMESYIVNTIHDSIITEESPTEVEELNRIAKEAFTQDVYNYLKVVYGIDFNVPLDVDSKSTARWASKYINWNIQI